MHVCVKVCVCVREREREYVRVCGACLCERNSAAEQGLSLFVREAHRVSQGWVSCLQHVTRSEKIVHLPASLWLLSPHPLGSPLLVDVSVQHWAL